jgi:hypothetical protein
MGILQTFSLAFIIPRFRKDVMHILDLLILPNFRMCRPQRFEGIINIRSNVSVGAREQYTMASIDP